MPDQFSRTRLLYGREAMDRLASCRIAVFGIGGVGGYVVEALARSGIGALDLIDNDTVSLTNLNRQIIATHKTIGKYKVDAAAERIAEIAPDCRVAVYRTFYLPETQEQFDFSEYDYVVDAIDTVTGKLALVESAVRSGVPIISSMGAGNKLDPVAFEVGDIYSTSGDPLARVMRRECRKRGIHALKVVWSREEPLDPGTGIGGIGAGIKAGTETDTVGGEDQERPVASRRSVPGSVAFVPAAAGLVIAGEVVADLTGVRRK